MLAKKEKAFQQKQQFHIDPNVAAVEKQSGISFKHVTIHYSSNKPQQVGALAYSYGNDIYIAPGQKKQLEHELGHVHQNQLGLVKPTHYIHNMPLNNNETLESTTMNYLRPSINTNTHTPRKIIQRKVAASVSLKLFDDNDNAYPAEAVLVDSIQLSGRDYTGLKNEGRPTQGDHTIADAFIKKHQKIITKNRNILEFFDLYSNLLNHILEENGFLEGYPDEFKVIQEKRVSESTILAGKTLEACTCFPEVGTLHNWRKMMTAILSNYNEAYAKSFVSSSGVGTGGRGEAAGIKYIKDELSKLPEEGEVDTSRINKLIDLDSLKVATGLEEVELGKDIFNHIIGKFHSMVEQIKGYKIKNKAFESIPFGNESNMDEGTETINWDALISQLAPEIEMEKFQNSEVAEEPEDPIGKIHFWLNELTVIIESATNIYELLLQQEDSSDTIPTLLQKLTETTQPLEEIFQKLAEALDNIKID